MFAPREESHTEGVRSRPIGSLERRIGYASLGAGVSYANLAIGLPLLALASGKSAFLAGSLLAVDTVAIAIGALAALALRHPESGVAYGLGLLMAGGTMLVLPPSTGSMALGALLHGAGHGLFWVGVQADLGRRAGMRGSERAFVHQYVVYVTGTIAGGLGTGLAIAAFRALGVGAVMSVSLGFLFGVSATLVALALVTVPRRAVPLLSAGRPRPTLVAGLALQAPDLLLVGSMGMLVSLAPVVLKGVFDLTPFVIGVAAAATAVAKIAGAFTAGRAAPIVGARTTVGSMLAASAVSVGLLVGVDQAFLYIALTVTATFFGIGAWPIIVDGALARVPPADRARVTIAWNVREYTAIGAATVVGGYLLDVVSSPAILLGFAALLLVCAAVSAFIVLRVPTHAAPVVGTV